MKGEKTKRGREGRREEEKENEDKSAGRKDMKENKYTKETL